jgi:hypothetical protein
LEAFSREGDEYVNDWQFYAWELFAGGLCLVGMEDGKQKKRMVEKNLLGNR